MWKYEIDAVQKYYVMDDKDTLTGAQKVTHVHRNLSGDAQFGNDISIWFF